MIAKFLIASMMFYDPIGAALPSSLSENNGIAALKETDLYVYSVGISTGGIAEMRMAAQLPERVVIATTIDQKGARFACEKIEAAGLSQRVIVKIEDVAQPLPYA